MNGPALAIRNFLRHHKQVDPTSFIEAAIVWGTINGFCLEASGKIMITRPSFAIIRWLGIGQHTLACVFLVDAAAMLVSIVLNSLPYRSTVALLSGMLWISYGVTSIISAGSVGVIGPAALGCVACGLGCLNAVTQWVYVGERK